MTFLFVSLFGCLPTYRKMSRGKIARLLIRYTITCSTLHISKMILVCRWTPAIQMNGSLSTFVDPWAESATTKQQVHAWERSRQEKNAFLVSKLRFTHQMMTHCDIDTFQVTKISFTGTKEESDSAMLAKSVTSIQITPWMCCCTVTVVR